MTHTILVTRPKEEHDALIEALQASGMRVICEPMMEIFLHHDQRHALETLLESDPDALVLTSRHGVRALASLSHVRDLPLICVGDATAQGAESLGFSRICAGGGTADKLVDYICDAYDPGSRFLYISGEHARIDVATALNGNGMQAERIVLYDAAAAQQLSDILLEQLKRGQIDAATFLSERTARIFCDLLAKTDAGACTENMVAFTLSSAIADALKPLRWKSLHVADQPTLASLSSSIDNGLAYG